MNDQVPARVGRDLANFSQASLEQQSPFLPRGSENQAVFLNKTGWLGLAIIELDVLVKGIVKSLAFGQQDEPVPEAAAV
jgi:hypothetical protein